MALFDVRLALTAFEKFVKMNKIDKTRVTVISEKLKQEEKERYWDHVFYIVSEDYKDEHGIQTILPPNLEDYIVSKNLFGSVSIKVLGKFGVSF
jgi:hypothetical protein